MLLLVATVNSGKNIENNFGRHLKNGPKASRNLSKYNSSKRGTHWMAAFMRALLSPQCGTMNKF